MKPYTAGSACQGIAGRFVAAPANLQIDQHFKSTRATWFQEAGDLRFSCQSIFGGVVWLIHDPINRMVYDSREVGVRLEVRMDWTVGILNQTTFLKGIGMSQMEVVCKGVGGDIVLGGLVPLDSGRGVGLVEKRILQAQRGRPYRSCCVVQRPGRPGYALWHRDQPANGSDCGSRIRLPTAESGALADDGRQLSDRAVVRDSVSSTIAPRR